MEFEIKVRESGAGFPIIEMAGEVDFSTAPAFKTQLVDLIEKGNYKILVDLERVEYLDSTGLGILVGGLWRVREKGGNLVLKCSQRKILQLFEITGLIKVFEIYQEEEKALKALMNLPA